MNEENDRPETIIFDNTYAEFFKWVQGNDYPNWAPRELLQIMYWGCGDIEYERAPIYLDRICRDEKMESVWNSFRKQVIDKYNKDPGNSVFNYVWEDFIRDFTSKLEEALNKDFRGSRSYRWDSLTPAETNNKKREIAKKLRELSRLLNDYPTDSGLIECLEDNELQALYKNMNWHVRLHNMNQISMEFVGENPESLANALDTADRMGRLFENLSPPIGRHIIYCSKSFVPAVPDLSVILMRAANNYDNYSIDLRLKTSAGEDDKVRAKFFMHTILTFIFESFGKPNYAIVAAIANTFGFHADKDQVKGMFKKYVSELSQSNKPG